MKKNLSYVVAGAFMFILTAAVALADISIDIDNENENNNTANASASSSATATGGNATATGGNATIISGGGCDDCGEESLYKITNYKHASTAGGLQITNGKPVQSFEITNSDESLGEFELPMNGKHNVLNAVAAIALCDFMQLDMEKVRGGIASFQGIKRRFEYIGEYGGALLIDDYAHHPDEIRATLSGARQTYPDKNITVVFHPHSFTRTKALLEEFSQSFEDADNVIVIDIYGSARENEGDVSSEDLVNLINKYQHGKAEYIPTIEEATDFLRRKEYGDDDIIMTMGAGDVWHIAEELKDRF